MKQHESRPVSFTDKEILRNGVQELITLERAIFMGHPNATLNGHHGRVPGHFLARHGYEKTKLSSVLTWDRLKHLGLVTTVNGMEVMKEAEMNILQDSLREQFASPGKAKA